MGKIGEGHFAAWLRQGLREVRAFFYPDSNIAQPAEYGLYGTRTPGEVAEARRSDSHELDRDSGSVLDDRLRQAAERDRGDDSRGPEMER